MGACIGKQPKHNRNSLQSSGGFAQNTSSTIVLKPKNNEQSYLSENKQDQNKSRQTNLIQIDKNLNFKDRKSKGQQVESQLWPENNNDPFNDEEQYRAATRSSIIKVVKKKRGKDDKSKQTHKNEGYRLSNQQQNQLQGEFQSSKKQEDTLRIRLTNLDIQFMLPKIQAGPLIVPFIDFSQYQTS